MHHSKILVFTLSLGVLGLTGACTKSQTDTSTPEPAMTDANANVADGSSDDAGQPDAGVVAQPTEPEPAATEPAAPPPPPPLADEEIVAVAMAAHDGEIEHAKIAKGKAKDKQVKDFAAMMTKHHTDAKKRGDKLVKKLAITPKDNELSTTLTTDAKTKAETLTATAKGAEFDRVYIDTQVQAHTAVLDALDTRLIPSAKNEELKAELQTTRQSVEEHLNKAKEIQTALGQAAAPTT